MGEAKCRRLTQAEIVREFLNHTVLRDPPKPPMVAIGPVVWGIEPGSDVWHSWFAGPSIDAAGKFHLDCLKIAEDDRATAEENRAMAVFALLENRGVIKDFDDELRMMQFCDQVSPCEKTHALRASIERERASK